MKKRHNNLPDVIDKSESEIKCILELIRNSALPDDVKNFVIKCIELALWLPLHLQNKRISLHRLRVMIFGKGYNKNDGKSAHNNDAIPEHLKSDEATSTPLPESHEIKPGLENNSETTTLPAVIAPELLSSGSIEKEKKPGHGRMPHTVYTNVVEIELLLKNLVVGDLCPELCGGKLGPYKTGVIIRIKGQNFAQLYRYFIEKLRCNLCGIIINANIPAEVGKEKYDESFKAMLAIMKYYVAIPFYRQEQFQKMLGFPLSDATQWNLIEKVAGNCYASYNELIYCAANSNMLQNDDTTLRILETIKQIKEGTAGNRTGMYTTGIIATYEEHKIALFINGRQHSGENVGDVLKKRTPDKDPIIQMADALSANIPKGMQTVLCNCLSHGFRKFEELVGFTTLECIFIVSKLSKVFEFDSETRTMSGQDRLAYHQKNSQPIMNELKEYMEKLINDKLVEPNSELGKSIKYMQRHWEKLTRFLTVAGAPIDNNIVERALKIAIRNRKSALFYRTEYSAGIGGMLTSIIYTCHLNGQNPHHYLVALQVHQAKVVANPKHWLPWNYLDAIAQQSEQADGANPPVHSPPLDFLVAA